jgi:peptidyl-dipeptidase Dcp
MLITACAQQPMESSASMTVAAIPALSGPFAQPSSLPYRLPPFDRITNADFKPGFEQGMAEQRREIDAIANNPAAPSFDNTIVAMERSGRMLARVSAVFFNLSSSNTNDEIDKIESEMAPRLSAHQDSIYLDSRLFARVQALYDKRQTLGLDAEGQRLVERYHTDFLRAGAQLSDADKQKLKAMNERLSSLTTQFQQNVLAATQAGAVTFDSKAQLAGLSDSQIAAAAEAAKSRGADGKYVITLQNTTTQPVLAQLSDRGSRERIYRASVARGNGGAGDTTGIVAEIVALRAERAALLGYPTHADYVLEEETAKTRTAVNKMLGELAPPAVANARREAAKIQQVIDAEAGKNGTKSFRLEPWDWQYYAEKVRVAEYSFDESQVKPYFELDHVLIDGVFYAASQLYGVSFKERHDLPVYQKDVRTFEIFDTDGSPMGLILIDYFARDNKQGGAWMNSFVEQSALFGTKPVVVNNLNIPKPPDGQPVLLTFDEVTTAFHEFGHALHGLFSDVQYPLFSGTNVPRDFVEYPSQYNEMWATDPKVLANYAKHYQTGEAMPQALMDKVIAAQKFDQGYAATEYLAAAMLDQSWHQISAAQAPNAAGVMPFEVAALEQAGVDYYAVPPRYHTTYFSHSFAGGYSAGYYAYIWSEVLAADTQHWMRTHGGLKRDNGDFLRKTLLSRGGSEDALALFRDFYGRDPEVQWLLEKRGLDTK